MTTYVLDFPRPDEWISQNERTHWAVRAPKTKAWRDATCLHARAAKVPAMGRVEVVAAARYTNRSRTRDLDRIAPTVKACVDGLVDAGVLADDSSDIVVRVSYEAGELADGVARLRLILVDRSDCPGPFTEATWAAHQAACGPCGVPFWQAGDAS